MNENTTLQQELNFRLSLLRLVTSTPFSVSPDVASTAESRQIESMCAMVQTGTNSARS